MDYKCIVDNVNKEINTNVKALQDLDYYSRKVNALQSPNLFICQQNDSNKISAPRRTELDELRHRYFPVTLGEVTKLHLELFKPISERITVSPPAFGPVRRPGDDYMPWQCVLAEEAPPLATTVYRQQVDTDDFETTIDKTGRVHITTGTQSRRRFSPKAPPPTAMDYLKSSIKAVKATGVCSASATFQRPDTQVSKSNVVESRGSLAPGLNSYAYSRRKNVDVNENHKLQVATPNCKSSTLDVNLMVSPVHQALVEERLKRFHLEEAMLKYAEKLDDLERRRDPVPHWYCLRTPQFFYEARKHNRRLMSHGRRTNPLWDIHGLYRES
ncbi:hypothetical protein PHET_02917 [Paragonimus heterotremus]|uniref:Uncharacterized protein n=1 Tax=Paragonimus heterotremus TaxID=100268 RepID=A0A8J4TPU1_9TREM|nr:hypothetical protein PHET_02917 [Paragonimus heterotremus]